MKAAVRNQAAFPPAPPMLTQCACASPCLCQTFGCGSAIASSSYTTEWLKGKSLEECSHIKNQDIAKHLKLPPVKLHCSMLAEDAVKMAIKDFQSKQPGYVEEDHHHHHAHAH